MWETKEDETSLEPQSSNSEYIASYYNMFKHSTTLVFKKKEGKFDTIFAKTAA